MSASLAHPFARDEPQIRTCRALLRRHRARLQVSVPTARGHHGDLDVVDVFVQLVELVCHGSPLAPTMICKPLDPHGSSSNLYGHPSCSRMDPPDRSQCDQLRRGNLHDLSAWLEPHRHAWYALPMVMFVFVALALVPVVLLIAATGLAFGPSSGRSMRWPDAWRAASVGFAIGRWMGRRRVEQLGGERSPGSAAR